MHGALICLYTKLQHVCFTELVKAVYCRWHEELFSLGVLECEGRSVGASKRREDDLSFVVSGHPVCSASS